MEEQIFAQNVGQLLGTAPKPIQSFILNELPMKIQQLMDSYGLHIDQGGVLETELFLMLVGQSQPEEFSAALEAAGVENAVLPSLLEEINRTIFVPLRTQMQSAPQSPTVVPPPTRAPLVPPMELVANVPPAPAPQVSVPPPAAFVPGGQGGVRTMAQDMEAVREHRAPRPTPLPETPIAPPVAPVPVVQETPRTAPPPSNLPGAPLEKQYGIDPYREPLE